MRPSDDGSSKWIEVTAGLRTRGAPLTVGPARRRPQPHIDYITDRLTSRVACGLCSGSRVPPSTKRAPHRKIPERRPLRCRQLAGATTPPSGDHAFPDHTFPGGSDPSECRKSVFGKNAPHLRLLPRSNTLSTNRTSCASGPNSLCPAPGASPLDPPYAQAPPIVATNRLPWIRLLPTGSKSP